jgi:Domain of unknown function (DUF4180)
MPSKSYELHGVRVLECDANEKQLRNYNEAVELIGKAFENRASLIVVPAECLDDDFFRLNTRIAGEMIQKVVQYRQRLVIVGDISRHLAESSALRAFVLEANRGKEVWFLATHEELDQRLARAV